MTTQVATWLPAKPDRMLAAALERLARTEDVAHVAVMPDAHVSEDVCVGTVTATTRRLLPAAVGSDIGCGMVALRFEAEAGFHLDRARAARILGALGARVPPLLRASRDAPPLPRSLDTPLSHPTLEKLRTRDARLAFGTLGRGNHFVELQRDEAGDPWLAVHSGSRVVGPAIRAHHEASARRDPGGLAWLDATTDAGSAYLSDCAWAATYAAASRAAILEACAEVIEGELGVARDPSSIILCDHNHVRREEHHLGSSTTETLWVHRKGAMHLERDALGLLPGSMGTSSFHVAGRAHPAALRSSAHGAGRALSRGEARRRIRVKQLCAEAAGVWFDHRIARQLCEEAPSAYKDVGAVMRAQRELVRVVRRLTPLLVYKAV